jgi:predicted esterase
MDRTSDDEDSGAPPLVYLTYDPRISKPAGKPPLILLLHGFSSNERDLYSLAPRLDPRLLALSLRAPLTRGPNSYAWFTVAFLPTGFTIAPEQLNASRKLVVEFIGAAVRQYDADPRACTCWGSARARFSRSPWRSPSRSCWRASSR